MIGIIITGLMTLTPQSVTVEDLALHVPNTGYAEERRRIGAQVSIYYRRSADRAAFTATLARMANPDGAWRSHTNISRVGTVSPSPSEIPLGDRSQFVRSTGSSNLYGQFGGLSADVQITYRGRGDLGSVIWDKHDEPGDIELIEGLARHILARARGRTLQSTGNVTIGNTTISGVMIAPSGELMIKLSDWVSAHGIVLNRNDRRGSFSFDYGGRSYVGAVAAKSLKRGSTWSSLPVGVLRADGHTYIPMLRFEELLN